MNIPRRVRRRLTLYSLVTFILFLIFYTILPPDSSIRLALNFNLTRFFNGLRGATTDRDAWLRKPARYPVDLRSDVGYLIKTGYGTRHRLPEQLRAFEKAGDMLGEEGKSFLVVGDWTTVNRTDAKRLGVTVHDALNRVIDTKINRKKGAHPRLLKYQRLQQLIDEGDEIKASFVGQSFGWELDALKFIMGMEMIYNDLPEKKKWYIILDDDTFVIEPSLRLLLAHLDPRKPYYIGNAVGDYKGRFAHGGSAIILSGGAMKRLFERPKIVAAAYRESLEETWGDRLVATTFQKLGIYIEEAFSHHFNGEPPSITRLWNDRFCSPLVSFHGLRKPGDMSAVGRKFAGVNRPVVWGQVWDFFGGPLLAPTSAKPPTEQRTDHVGNLDEHTRTWGEVQSANACEARCEENGNWCLAWTYEVESRRCYASPWMILGAAGADGKASGVNWKKAKELRRECWLT